MNRKSSKRHRVYLYGMKEGIGRMNYYVIRSVKGCKRRKEIKAAHGIRERLQGMELQSLCICFGHVAQEFRKAEETKELERMGKGHESVVASQCCLSSTLVHLGNCEILKERRIYRQSFIFVNKQNIPSWD